MITNRTELDNALLTIFIGQKIRISYDFLMNDLSSNERNTLRGAQCLWYDVLGGYHIVGNTKSSRIAKFSTSPTSPDLMVSTSTTKSEPEKDVDYFDIVKDLCS